MSWVDCIKVRPLGKWVTAPSLWTELTSLLIKRRCFLLSASENREKAQLVGNISVDTKSAYNLAMDLQASSSKRQLCITFKFLKFFFIADIQTNVEIGIKSGMFLYYLKKNVTTTATGWRQDAFACVRWHEPVSQEKGVTEDMSPLLEITHSRDCGQNMAGSTEDGSHSGEFSDTKEGHVCCRVAMTLTECGVLVLWGSRSAVGETGSLTNGDLPHATPFDSSWKCNTAGNRNR